MYKLGRNYSLSVQKNNTNSLFSAPGSISQNEYLTVGNPFTLEFDINRSTLGGTNVANLKVFNLSQNSRDGILKTSFDLNNQKIVILRAGYGATAATLPVCFYGMARECTSVRVGTEFITEITAICGLNAYINVFFTNTYAANTPYQTILDDLGSQILKSNTDITGVDFRDPIAGSTIRELTVSGLAIDSIRDIVGTTNVYIDNGILTVRAPNVTASLADNIVPVISSGNGLLGVPMIQGKLIVVEMLFEPTISLGQQFRLESPELPRQYNTNYIVNAVHHRGVISGAISGDAITTIEAWFPIPISGGSL